ncbi:MAG TPA: hypothetical protein DE179_00905 [Oceanospirillaceae bacterium]|nr:hypothetical protein [Oceanospirillaceae bacterium]
MFYILRQDRLFGALVLLASCALLFGWIPNDIDTGVLEKVRRRWTIGDAMMPTIASYIMAAAGLWLMLKPKHDEDAIKAAHVIWRPLAIIALSLLVMRYLGPITADLFGLEYRQIRTQIPWVYLGYVIGGGGMIFVLSCWEENRWTWKRLVISLAIALAIALVLDLPLEDVQLPPNGDVG